MTAAWMRIHHEQGARTRCPNPNDKVPKADKSSCAHAAAAAQVEGGHHAVALLHILDLVAHILHDAHELQERNMTNIRF
jgi:hypothetical protein